MRDLCGFRSGRLVGILRRPDGDWLAGCDCGALVEPVTTADLASGRRKSCGCLKRKQSVEGCVNPAQLYIRRRVERGEQAITEQVVDYALEGVPNSKQKFIRWAFTRQPQG